MNRRRIATTIVTLAACIASRLFAYSPLPTQHPSFGGVWMPSVPEASDRRFAVGLTLIPGHGRLSIEQRENRLTVTMTIPDDKLDVMLRVQGRFYPTAMYYLSETEGRSGGYGANGQPQLTKATWFGDRLVVPDPWPGLRYPTTQTYSLDGGRLKLETHVEVSAGRESDVAEWFTRVK
jgi:hypothetical protein